MNNSNRNKEKIYVNSDNIWPKLCRSDVNNEFKLTFKTHYVNEEKRNG